MATYRPNDTIWSHRTGHTAKITLFVTLVDRVCGLEYLGVLTSGSAFTDDDVVYLGADVFGTVVFRHATTRRDFAIVKLRDSITASQCTNVLRSGIVLEPWVRHDLYPEGFAPIDTTTLVQAAGTTTAWVRPGLHNGLSASGRIYQGKIEVMYSDARFGTETYHKVTVGKTGQLLVNRTRPIGMLWGHIGPALLYTPLAQCFDMEVERWVWYQLGTTDKYGVVAGGGSDELPASDNWVTWLLPKMLSSLKEV